MFEGYSEDYQNTARSIISKWRSDKKGLSIDDIADQFGGATKELKSFLDQADKTRSVDDLMTDFGKTLSNTAKKGQTFGERMKTGFKTFGRAALGSIGNIGANLAIDLALQAAMIAWDNYSNRQENAIKKGQETLSDYQSDLQEFTQTSNMVDDVGQRFEELHKGVSSSGQNIGLTTDEFEEYQNIVSQLATAMPELIDGYDSMGNPIISTASNVRDITEALQEQKRALSQDNINKAKDYADAFNATMNQMPTDFSQESGLLQQRDMLDSMMSDINAGKDIAEKYFGASDLENVIAGIKVPLQTIFGTLGGMSSSLAEGVAKAKAATEPINKLVAQDIAEAAGVNDEVLKEIQSGELDESTEQYVRDKVTAYAKQVESQMNAQFDNTKPLLESMLMGDDNGMYYNKLKDQTKSALSQIVNAMDIDDAMGSGFIDEFGNLDTDQFKDWADGVAKELQDSNVQDSIEDLFSLKDRSADMGYRDYLEETDDLVKSITDKVPWISEEMLKSATGMGDELDDLKQKRVDLMNDGFGEDFLNDLSIEDLEILWDLNADGVVKGANEAKQAIEEAKKAMEESDPDRYFNAWQEATSTENQGHKYDTMYSGFESAMNAYEQGLVGTDDFKTFASLISPTGSDDARNFAENYPKFQRYFTEGKEGIDNFLSDITGLVDSTGQAFATLDQETGRYDFNVSDLDALGQKLGISSEMVGALFGKMREYGIDNNIISSVEEGATRTGELIRNLQEEQNRYNKLVEETPEGEQGYSTDAGSHTYGNQTAIDESRRKIQEYNEDIQETAANTQKLIDTQNESAESRRDAAIAAAKALNDEKQAAEDSGMYDTADLIQGEMDKLGEKYGFNVDAEVNFDMEDAESDVDQLSDRAWNLVENGKDASKTLNSMAEKIGQVASHGGDVSSMVEDFNALAEESGSIYRMDDLGNKFDVSEEIKGVRELAGEAEKLAQSGGDASSVMANMVDPIQKLAAAGIDVSSLVKSYNNLAEETGSEFRMDMTGQIVSVDQPKETPTIDVKAKISSGPEFPKTNETQMNDLMGQFENAYDKWSNANSGGMLTNPMDLFTSQSDMMDIATKISQQPAEIRAKFGIEGETPEEIIGELTNGEYEIKVKSDTSEAEQGVKETTSEVENSNPLLKMGADTSEAESTTQKSLLELAQEKTETQIGADTSELENKTTKTLTSASEEKTEMKIGADTSEAEEKIDGTREALESTVAEAQGGIVKGTMSLMNADLSSASGIADLNDYLSSIESDTRATVTVDVEGESDVENLISSMQNAPDSTPVTFECNVENQEQLDTLQQAADSLNAEGKQIELEATVGEVDTSSVDATPGEELEIPVTVKLDESQFSALTQGMSGDPVEIPTKLEDPEMPDTESTEKIEIPAEVEELDMSSVESQDMLKIPAEVEPPDLPEIPEGDTVEYPSEVEPPDTPSVEGEPVEYPSTVTPPDPPDVQGDTVEYPSEVTPPETPTVETPAPVEIPTEVEPPATPEVPEGGTVTYDSTVEQPDLPSPPEGGTVNYTSEVEAPSPPAPPTGGDVHYSSTVDTPTPPAPPAGGTVHYSATVDPPTITDEQATVNYTVNDPPPPNYPDQNPSVNYHLNAPAPPSYPNISRTITYTIQTIGSIPGKASGTMLSPSAFPARASGTAYNVINYKNAYAGGKVSLPKDETALVNELGGLMPSLNLSNAGTPLEPCILQHSHEIWASVNV